MLYNIYCDESCHIQNDNFNSMVLGAIYCDAEKKKDIFNDIRNIKTKHGINSWIEIKWTKVSPSKINFYKELINYFFDNDEIHFRAVIAQDKKNLDLEYFNIPSYDEWYYRMYYLLLNKIIIPDKTYRIFLDMKDTYSGRKAKKLREVLSNNIYDFSYYVIKDIHIINSKESELLQLGDLLIGAIAYLNNGNYDKPSANAAKKELIDIIQYRSSKSLMQTTTYSEDKLNLFFWLPKEVK